MLILGASITGIGLVLALIAALKVLPDIFITDDEIERLAKLPLAESGTRFTERGSGVNHPSALLDLAAAEEYTKRFIDARKSERSRGKTGLKLLVIGFALQLAGLVIATIGASA